MSEDAAAMTNGDSKLRWWLMVSLATALTGGATWWATYQQSQTARIIDVQATRGVTVARIETRVEGLERRVDGLATAQEVNDLRAHLLRIEGKLDRLLEGRR